MNRFEGSTQGTRQISPLIRMSFYITIKGAAQKEKCSSIVISKLGTSSLAQPPEEIFLPSSGIRIGRLKIVWRPGINHQERIRSFTRCLGGTSNLTAIPLTEPGCFPLFDLA
jgi:hypothetical protein